jgi:hypothetical protein
MIYGYAVVDKDGNPAPLNRKVYDARNAAAVGFNHWTRRMYGGDYEHLKGKKLSEQTEFRVVGLVLANE